MLSSALLCRWGMNLSGSREEVRRPELVLEVLLLLLLLLFLLEVLLLLLLVLLLLLLLLLLTLLLLGENKFRLTFSFEFTFSLFWPWPNPNPNPPASSRRELVGVDSLGVTGCAPFFLADAEEGEVKGLLSLRLVGDG